jgi:hypothetical protein
LRRRLVDWERKTFGRRVWRFKGGRVHTRELPKFTSLDEDSERDRLESTLTDGSRADGSLGFHAQLQAPETELAGQTGETVVWVAKQLSSCASSSSGRGSRGSQPE